MLFSLHKKKMLHVRLVYNPKDEAHQVLVLFN